MTKGIYQRVSYLCPNCQQIFKPKLSTWMFAAHTPKTRKLQCPHCYQTHHCVTTLKQEIIKMKKSVCRVKT